MASVTLDVVMRLVDQVTGKLNTINAALQQTNTSGQRVNTTMQAFQSGLAGLTLFAVYDGLKRIAMGMSEVAQAGAQFERVLQSFKIMTELSGESYITVLGEMRQASRGTVSDMQLMLSANKALSLGVAQTGEEIGELIKVSTVLGRRTGLGQEAALERLMVGIGRLSPRILDDLGIAVNLTRLYRESTSQAASELDQSQKIQILLNKVLKDGAEILAEYPQGLEDTASGFERMSAAWSNFIAEVGQTAPFDLLADLVGGTASAMESSRLETNALSGNASSSEIYKLMQQYSADLKALMSGEIEKMSAEGLKMFQMTGTEGLTLRVEQLTDAYDKAATKAWEFAEAQDYIDSRGKVGSGDLGSVVDAGEAALAKFEELKAAQEDLKIGEMFGRQDIIDRATANIARIGEEVYNLMIAYNELAEGRDYSLVDEVKAKNGELAIQGIAEEFDLLKVSEDRASVSHKRTAEDLADIERRAKAAAHAYIEMSNSAVKAAESSAVDFQVKNPGAASADVTGRALGNLRSQLDYLERIESKWLTEEQLILRVAQAHQVYNDTLSGAQDNIDNTKVNEALAQAKVLGDTLLTLAPGIANAIHQMSGADSSPQNLIAMQEQIVKIGEAYNKVAIIAGLPLIDIEALKRGSFATQNLTADVDVLSRAELQLKTYAEMVGTALNSQTVAMGMTETAVAGFEVQVLQAVSALGSLMSLDAKYKLFTEVVASGGTALEGVVEAGGDANKMYLAATEIIDREVGSVVELNAALRDQGTEAEDLADTIRNKLISAYDSLNSIVSGELRDSLNELSNVGIGEKDFAEVGVREDVPAENARRLAALMKEGVKDQPWLEEFKREAPGIWDEYINAADPAAAAARMLQEFQKGLRPELIDFEQLKQQIKDNLETNMRLEGMGKQLTDELIAEMGDDGSGTIQKFVAQALGLGFDESGFGTDSAAKLFATLTSEDMKLKMQDAGAQNAANMMLGFNGAVPEHMQPFFDLMIAYVTPGVEALINQKNAASKAK